MPLATRGGGQGGLCQCCPRAVVEDRFDLLAFFLGFCLLAQLSAVGSDSGGCRTHEHHLSQGEDSSHHPMSPFCSLLRNLQRAPTPPLRMKTPKVPFGSSGKVGRLFWRGPHGSSHPPYKIFATAKPTTIKLPWGPSEAALTPQVVSLLGC